MIKNITISAIVMILTFLAVTANSIVCTNIFNALCESVQNANGIDDYKELQEELERRELYLSITIGNNALAELRYGAAELYTYANEGSHDEEEAAKSRLYSRLDEQRRLAGFTFSSIF